VDYDLSDELRDLWYLFSLSKRGYTSFKELVHRHLSGMPYEYAIDFEVREFAYSTFLNALEEQLRRVNIVEESELPHLVFRGVISNDMIFAKGFTLGS